MSQYCNVDSQRVSRQRLDKHVPVNTQQWKLRSLWAMLQLVSRWRNNTVNRGECFLCGPCRDYIATAASCQFRFKTELVHGSYEWQNQFRAEFLSYELRVNNSGERTPTELIGTRSTQEYRRLACEGLACDLKTLFMCNIWSVWLNETVLVSVLRSVAGRRLVKTENPSACATVNWKLCKSAIALY
jgi:hypothetical protein